jgi:hypothetical protein
MNVITMTTKKQAPNSSKRQTIDNTPELREALVWAAIGLGYDRTDELGSEDEASDRKAARKLSEFARQLGATLVGDPRAQNDEDFT